MFYCNLCGKELGDLSYNLRGSKIEESDVYLISIIENAIRNSDSLENISDICKVCNDLLLELHMLKCRQLEIQNVLQNYVEKKQEMLLYLPENSFTANNKINDEQQTAYSQQNSNEELQLFDEIIENSCHSERDDFMYDNLIHNNDQSDFELEKKAQNFKTEINQKVEYTCDCKKVFYTKDELKACKKSHSEHQPFVCELCGQAYRQKRGFKTHLKMHHGLNPFTCVYCNKSFTQKIALIRHVPLHTGEKPYQCEECGKRFTHHTSFSAHKLIHTGEKPFKCPHCSEAFRSSSHLKRHKRIHTGEKKFGCITCGKHFAERYNLAVHQKIHTNEKANRSVNKKHRCQICGEGFERPGILEEHKEKKHLSVKKEHLNTMYKIKTK